MRTLSSSLTTLGHLGCDRRGDQSGGEKELHFGAMVAENTRRCATAPPDAFSDQVLENLGATPHEGHEKVGFPEVSPNAPALQHNAPDGPRSSSYSLEPKTHAPPSTPHEDDRSRERKPP